MWPFFALTWCIHMASYWLPALKWEHTLHDVATTRRLGDVAPRVLMNQCVLTPAVLGLVLGLAPDGAAHMVGSRLVVARVGGRVVRAVRVDGGAL